MDTGEIRAGARCEGKEATGGTPRRRAAKSSRGPVSRRAPMARGRWDRETLDHQAGESGQQYFCVGQGPKGKLRVGLPAAEAQRAFSSPKTHFRKLTRSTLADSQEGIIHKINMVYFYLQRLTRSTEHDR